MRVENTGLGSLDYPAGLDEDLLALLSDRAGVLGHVGVVALSHVLL